MRGWIGEDLLDLATNAQTAKSIQRWYLEFIWQSTHVARVELVQRARKAFSKVRRYSAFALKYPLKFLRFIEYCYIKLPPASCFVHKSPATTFHDCDKIVLAPEVLCWSREVLDISLLVLVFVPPTVSSTPTSNKHFSVSAVVSWNSTAKGAANASEACFGPNSPCNGTEHRSRLEPSTNANFQKRRDSAYFLGIG